MRFVRLVLLLLSAAALSAQTETVNVVSAIILDSATTIPRWSTAPEIPVFAARTSERPDSTARNRWMFQCWRGPREFPNQPSLVRTTRMPAPSRTALRAKAGWTGS